MLKKLVILSLLLLYAVAAARESRSPPKDLVRSSCVHASYPNLCVRTLSSYSGPAITTPRDLARAAVGISLTRARRVAAFLAGLKDSSSSLRRRRDRGAVSDCLEQMADSVDELSRTLGVLKHLGPRSGDGEEEFRLKVSNAETWVSAALTNEDTCLDGFDEADGEIKYKVKRKITNVARVTSNALYMINQLDRT